jgi:hypothetical protein
MQPKKKETRGGKRPFSGRKKAGYTLHESLPASADEFINID